MFGVHIDDKKCSDGYFYYWDSCSVACVLGNIIKDGLDPVIDGPIDDLINKVLDGLKNLFGDAFKYVGYALIGVLVIVVLFWAVKLTGIMKSKLPARPRARPQAPAPAPAPAPTK